MQVIMGGSGSTGSSLLKNILNRHHDIFAGGETAFFAKQMIYENWEKAKSRVLKRRFYGLRNHGWHIYNGTDLLQPEYLWELDDLSKALKTSETLQSFTSSFYTKPMNLKGASIWLEKTPANSACFSSFLKTYPQGKVIHIVRNPFDTIASLQNRGIDLFYAVGIYLLNTACGLSVIDSENAYTIKYEDLIAQPKETVIKLCRFLNIEYEKHMIEPQGEVVSKPKLSGWKYDETKAIGKGSVGRFNVLSEEAQDAILQAVNLIRINEKGRGYYETSVRDIREVCDTLEYDFYNIGKRSTYPMLKQQMNRDRWNRVRRGYPTGFYYPLEIRK